jgi:hypothetical protein
MYKAGGNDHHARDFLELEKCVEASSLASTPYHASHSKGLLTDCTPTLDAGSPTDGGLVMARHAIHGTSHGENRDWPYRCHGELERERLATLGGGLSSSGQELRMC